MLRGRLYESDYKPKLSGHETFPLRYGWLKKAFDAVSDTEDPNTVDQSSSAMTLSRGLASARTWLRPCAIGL